MQRIKRITAMMLCILILSGVCVFGTTTSAFAGGTGAGLAEWALNAYYSGWSYVYGGASPGAVDCSGLIYSYCGGERCGNPQLNTATETGNVSAGIPRIHGLGLWRPGHVGVYIADNMEVDARGDAYGVCYESISGYNNWTYWFKLAAVTYPTTGWEKFNGDYYYYENGQYIVNTSREIDGKTYYFDAKGVSSSTPSNPSSSSSSSSSSNNSSSKPAKPTSWRNGSTGEEVIKIQNRLTELGYYTGAIDGNFGDATEQAYRAFQEAAGLTVDGIAGSDREVLYSDDAPTAPKEETTQESEVEETTPSTEDATEESEESESKTETIEYKFGDENEKVTEIQAQLATLKYFDLEPTGYYGDYTEQAIKNFQLANNLVVTGIVDEETLALLYNEDAIENPNPTVYEDATEATEAYTSAISSDATISEYIGATEKNQSYADTAVELTTKTNKVTKKALSKSSSLIPAATKAEVKRTANIWIWFVLVVTVFSTLAIVFILRDKKTTRYARYVSKKKKLEAKVNFSERW